MDRSMTASANSTSRSAPLSPSRGATGSRIGRPRRNTYDSIPGAGRIKAIFYEHDADKNGTICRDELAIVLQALIPGIKEHSIDLLFEQIDVNDDGVIQYEEFIDWLMDGSEGPTEGRETWYDAVEAILTKGLFLTSTGLCGRWSVRRKKGSKRRETYCLLSCGVVSYSMYESRYTGNTCSLDTEEVTGFGEWSLQDGAINVSCSVHVELCSGSGVHVDRLHREETRVHQWPISGFEAQFSRTGLLDGFQEVRIMLAMFGERCSSHLPLHEPEEVTICEALADAGGHSGKAAYLLHKQWKADHALLRRPSTMT